MKNKSKIIINEVTYIHTPFNLGCVECIFDRYTSCPIGMNSCTHSYYKPIFEILKSL